MIEPENISFYDGEFARQYGKGTVIETNITAIIKPSQIITVFYEGFTGRLSVLDISWCLPEGEEKFRKSKIGDRITCVVLDIDFKNKQVMLSQKHLAKPLSDTIKWERIERGDEFQVDIIEELNDTLLVKTSKGLYGLLHKSLLKLPGENLKVKVNTKLDYSDLLSFVPASLEIADEFRRFSSLQISITLLEFPEKVSSPKNTELKPISNTSSISSTTLTGELKRKFRPVNVVEQNEHLLGQPREVTITVS